VHHRVGANDVFHPHFTGGTPENPTGFEALSSWLGMTAENGGHYLYALDNMRIHAAPVLQPGLEAMVNSNDVKSPHPNIARMLARVGSFRSFTLAGVEAITDRPFTGSHYAVWAWHPSLKPGRRGAIFGSSSSSTRTSNSAPFADPHAPRSFPHPRPEWLLNQPQSRGVLNLRPYLISL
jgi:hypothetical protein